ncbi:sensory neuron membrane protein 2-like [Melitaea cinxia]|uniref:sensory neuron membrane protein 2-like n=1 Tax=Melitaea cinxia TaxID=113334 RepID=UPI001E26EB83|nr:sensory neuron membrane protein 2-like [Melitaea cinxia]
MCNTICGGITTGVGLVLVVVSCIVTFAVVPGIVDDLVRSEVQLINETEQMDRFEEVPFALTFTVRIFNISNPDEVLNGGVPQVRDIGPYVYKMTQRRVIEAMDADTITYRRVDDLVFDEEASYPYSVNDTVTLVNAAYHGMLQMAEQRFPALMQVLPAAMNGIFGENNGPIMTVRAGDLLFDGIPLCRNPGILGTIACIQIRTLAQDVRNIEVMEDGTLEFSVLRFKDNRPSEVYNISRGFDDPLNLGIISTYNGSIDLNRWATTGNESDGEPSICNLVRGTDTGIFPPFVDTEKPIYGFNTDICRVVELRYITETSHQGIPALRFVAGEWFLDNNEGCFCLNLTRGINADNGCLLTGAIELYNCVGTFLVLTYPHFLYADHIYRNGVIGVSPSEENHRIFVDLEPLTGTIVRGMKKAQFNVFMRPVTSIPATQNLRTTLTPIVWVEEGMELPDQFVNLLQTRLVDRLSLIEILLPVAIAVCCLVAVIGIIILTVALCRRNINNSNKSK